MGFDPDELTRKLYELKAQQEFDAAKKGNPGLGIRDCGSRRTTARNEHNTESSNWVQQTFEGKEQLSRDPKSRQSRDVFQRAPPEQRNHWATTGQHSTAPVVVSNVWPRRWSAGHRETQACSEIARQDIPKSYHHTPQVAASQFERTTVVEHVEGVGIHRLSHPAVRFHLDGPNGGEVTQDQTGDPREVAQGLRRARSQRDREYARNQFQNPQSLKETNLISGSRLQQRHTIDSIIGAGQTTRPSVFPPSDTIRDMLGTSNHIEHCDDEEVASNGRNSWVGSKDTRQDWTQSDEMGVKQNMNTAAPKIRKAASKWRLRLSSHPKSEGEAEFAPLPSITYSGQFQSASERQPKELRSPISGFFSRKKL